MTGFVRSQSFPFFPVPALTGLKGLPLHNLGEAPLDHSQEVS